MAKVIRYCIKNETHNGENCFLIHRPFVFSNPFTHIKNKETKAKYVVENREGAIKAYEDYFDIMVRTSPRFKDEWDKLYEAYKKYDEIYIGCYCSLNEHCHGDVLIEKLKKRSIQEMLNRYKAKTQVKLKQK